MSNLISEKSGFSQRLDELIARTTYRLVVSADELETIYRLRHDANVREGTILPNETGKLHDRFDETPNCMNIAILVDGEVLAALRLHYLSPTHPVSPALDAYPDIIGPMLEAGAHFIDTSRLAANFPQARMTPQLPYVTLRLGIMAAHHFGAHIITGGCRAEHFPFYAREFFAVRACPPRPYPTLVKPLCLVTIDFRKHHQAIIDRRPGYDSQRRERERLFSAAAVKPDVFA